MVDHALSTLCSEILVYMLIVVLNLVVALVSKYDQSLLVTEIIKEKSMIHQQCTITDMENLLTSGDKK